MNPLQFQFVSTVRLGIKSLLLHKLRSVLTMLGIIFGVCSVIGMLAIGEGGLILALTARAEPCQTIAHWFVERRIARISSKVNPADARWYASVVSEGPMATGDRVEVVRVS